MVKSREIDMLHGPMGKKMVFFALLLMATGILEQLFNAADVAVVGNFVSADAMAAVGANSSLISLFVNLFLGISLGANVVISRFIGQGDQKGVEKAVHTSILVALISGVLLTVFGEVLAPQILGLMGVPEKVLPMAVLYLRVYLLGMPVILLYNFESAIFRSQGDTRTPLLCLTVSGIINVGLNLFFVLVVKMTVDGVATATVISNAISSILLFVLLVKTPMTVHVTPSKLSIDPVILKQILLIGIPAGVQGCVFSLSNVIIQSAINSLGATIMAASAAAFNIEIIAYFPINAFCQTVTTFIGQNYGAGNRERCERVLKLGLIQTLCFQLVCETAIIALAPALLSFFNSDPTVIAYGVTRIHYILIPYALDAIMETFSGAMRGYGRSLAPAIIILVSICGVRISWVTFVFPHLGTFSGLLLCYGISWAVAAAILIVAYFRMVPTLSFPTENRPAEG